MDFRFRDGRPFAPSVFHLFFFLEKAYVICLDRQFPSIFTFFTFLIYARQFFIFLKNFANKKTNVSCF
jgi:hypothetical protein